MDIFTFDWDEANIGHIAEHDITPIEAEEVIRNRPIVVEYQNRAGEPRIRQIGETSTGRILTVVTTRRGQSIRVVTAFPAKRRQRAQFLQARGRTHDPS
jgi:uncharacterized DUF497 family protein